MTSDPGHVGPKVSPDWWDLVRQIVMFGLAVWLLVFAATSPGHDIPLLVVALILFGLISVESFMDRFVKHRHVESSGPEGVAPPDGSAPNERSG